MHTRLRRLVHAILLSCVSLQSCGRQGLFTPPRHPDPSTCPPEEECLVKLPDTMAERELMRQESVIPKLKGGGNENSSGKGSCRYPNSEWNTHQDGAKICPSGKHHAPAPPSQEQHPEYERLSGYHHRETVPAQPSFKQPPYQGRPTPNWVWQQHIPRGFSKAQIELARIKGAKYKEKMRIADERKRKKETHVERCLRAQNTLEAADEHIRKARHFTKLVAWEIDRFPIRFKRLATLKSKLELELTSAKNNLATQKECLDFLESAEPGDFSDDSDQPSIDLKAHRQTYETLSADVERLAEEYERAQAKLTELEKPYMPVEPHNAWEQQTPAPLFPTISENVPTDSPADDDAASTLSLEDQVDPQEGVDDFLEQWHQAQQTQSVTPALQARGERLTRSIEQLKQTEKKRYCHISKAFLLTDVDAYVWPALFEQRGAIKKKLHVLRACRRQLLEALNVSAEALGRCGVRTDSMQEGVIASSDDEQLNADEDIEKLARTAFFVLLSSDRVTQFASMLWKDIEFGKAELCPSGIRLQARGKLSEADRQQLLELDAKVIDSQPEEPLLPSPPNEDPTELKDPECMDVSQQGLGFICQFEGFSATKYKVNNQGRDTIGYGHEILTDEEGEFDDGITKAKATELLKRDVGKAMSEIKRYVKVPLNQYQFDALVSYVYNVGEGGAFLIRDIKTRKIKKTQFIQKLNAGDYQGAASEMDICTQNGNFVQGLANRRAAERALFLSGCYKQQKP